MLGVEGHDCLADRPLHPEAPVTARDGDLDPSPFPAGFLDRRSNACLEVRDGAAVSSADGLDDEGTEEGMLFDLAQEVFHHAVNLIRISGREDDVQPL